MFPFRGLVDYQGLGCTHRHREGTAEKELQDILHYTAIYRGTQLQLFMSTIFSELFYDLINFTFQNVI